jgi:hypothetical protein
LQGIVSLSAFPKSGVTYLSFLLFYSFFSDECDIHDLERKYIIDVHLDQNVTFANPCAPRLIKSHYPYNPAIPEVRVTSKAIYLIRHPIDVMMSAWNYDNLLNGTVPDTRSPEFRAYIHRWLTSGGVTFRHLGPWTQHVRSWLDQKTIPVHLVTYENLVDNPGRELKSIIDFIGVHVSTDRQRIAIQRSSMKSMAAIESEEVEKRTEGIFFHNNLAVGYNMGLRFINKGYRKSYESVLTAEERAIADKTFGSEITRFYGNRP